MSSKAGTLTLNKDQDISPVSDNPQEAIQLEDTKMLRMHLRSHDQSPMVHQGKTVKHHPNSNSNSTMRLGGTTVVTAPRVPRTTQGKTDQAAIQICNIIYWPLQTSQICTSTYQPNIIRYIKVGAIF